jgi:large subunit ribosomal protein L17
MRHNVAHRKLGRVTEHRLALLRNQAIALLRHEKIETTMPKAKELRPFVERLITIARRGVAAGDAAGKTLHARRMVQAELPDNEVVSKLFETLAPRFSERPGGYTRILRVGYRRGDSAEVALIELVGSEYNPAAKVEKDEEGGEDTPKKAKGVGERIKRAAQRMRGDKGEAGHKAQAGGQTKGAARKSTTPRKAGGS